MAREKYESKDHFDEPVGKEMSAMLMRLAFRHQHFEEDIFQLIDSIEKYIKEKNTLRHSYHIHDPHQVNIGSDVENKYNEQNN